MTDGVFVLPPATIACLALRIIGSYASTFMALTEGPKDAKWQESPAVAHL